MIDALGGERVIERADKFFEGLLITFGKLIWLSLDGFAGFDIVDRRIAGRKRERSLDRIEYLKCYHFMPGIAQKLQRFYYFVGIVEKIANDDHQPPPLNALQHEPQRRLRFGFMRRFGLLQDPKHLAEITCF